MLINVKGCVSDYLPLKNDNGGYYEEGKSFSIDKWCSIIEVYKKELHEKGRCTQRKLADLCKISKFSAQKAIEFALDDSITIKKRGHGRSGPGSLKGFDEEHHRFLYRLYRENRRRPIETYIEELKNVYGINVSPGFITYWFHHCGDYKGKMRKPSKFPFSKKSDRVIGLLKDYIKTIYGIDDHRRLVFADEKPLKEIDIYGKTRRDPFTGHVDYIECNANSRNRFNILAAVSVKEDLRHNIETIIIEETGTGLVFQTFVAHLVRVGVLRRGDVFIVDNCTIHMKGDNEGIVEVLWNDYGIIMITLPPYHPELNPTEFVFNYLVQILRRDSARTKARDVNDFIRRVQDVLLSIPNNLIVKEYKHCGYLRHQRPGEEI